MRFAVSKRHYNIRNAHKYTKIADGAFSSDYLYILYHTDLNMIILYHIDIKKYKERKYIPFVVINMKCNKYNFFKLGFVKELLRVWELNEK